MSKRRGFTCFALMLLAGISVSVNAAARERPVTIPWENESIEALCFPMENGMPNTVCVTLYAAEDGYELCVSNEAASTERCVSAYRFGDPDGSEDDGPNDSRWSVVNL
ncbi:MULTISPECIES: hypothetical protein [Hyphomicrobiales]|jgi:hypothetical protein|uniref:Uncharacterized protein n=3 Tax=Hyphomicrobiales TaxID=356 RepID=A0A285V412_9HYPH|nr:MULTISPECIES: hypothetical protein [Hyphomicrobiales]SOC48358.1 hypothetical protein SAMN05892877_1536 [Rhizobium subbaraonis]